MTWNRYMIFSLLAINCLMPANCLGPFTGFSETFSAVKTIIYNGYDKFRCRLTSCCDDRWIIKNIPGLEKDLTTKLHGQHLVHRSVIGHVRGHLRTKDPPKALVLSFHGLTGVGKNFVSRIIAENLYKNGLHSPFVHLISATKEFRHEGMIEFYKEQLKGWIEGNVTKCDRSMFIFDEVDKLPALLLDVIKPYLDYYEHLGGVNYRKNIFLFLSNAHGSDLGHLMYKHRTSGKQREDLELSEVENNIMLSAINSDNGNGLYHSQLISNHLITAFIPFLPLEKNHVRQCIRDALVIKKYYRHDKDIPVGLVDKVVKELKFYPEVEQMFSSTGCKRVSEKIDYVMMDEPTHTGHAEL